MFRLDGKTALVTGGSTGIGEMIASGLITAGARVLICARKPDALDDTARRIGAEPIVADLQNETGIDALVAAVNVCTEALHILVNNAGAGWGAPLGSFPRAGFDKSLNLNLTAPFMLIQGLLPKLRAAASAEDPARIINITSIDGTVPPRGPTYSYSASKAGLDMLSRHLASALVSEHITCNAIAPGLFATRMTRHMTDSTHPRYDDRPNIPMNRPGRPEEIAGTVIYLASRAGSYVTGAVIPVSGGVGCF